MSQETEVEQVPIALGLVNIVFGVLQAVIYYMQYIWGKQLAEEETLYAHTAPPDIEVH